MILNEPVQVRFQVGFLSVSVCAGVTHLFIYLFRRQLQAHAQNEIDFVPTKRWFEPSSVYAGHVNPEHPEGLN